MIYLAHRGYWRKREERNTPESFRKAFASKYGVELDVRDQGGRLVISHDVPTAPCQPFSEVVDDYRAAGMPGWIAINIKADGLTRLLEAEFGRVAGVAGRCFVFDMSVPDTLHYLRPPFVVFTRHSEYEPVPPLEARTAGTWFDCFEQPWVSPERVIEELKRGRYAAVVSPELHGRDVHEKSWSALRDALGRSGLSDQVIGERLLLCTDLPDEAARFFGNERG